ncbi:GNAT family N-acetyltransferase [Methylobacterium durans]|uniref:Acyl-CoA acyltransferase n=1 Tax=Methylobacterium durans TaxID=2202825 RepID=A0A2U8W9N1_9HYPH|nr:acyl-CoA acyltransferase [Methylobacterium durans]AWN42036.1 acyl-CoA acyltransferase [Methylobacterium durans]
MSSAIPQSAARLRCRRIVADDRPALAALLARGFPARSVAEWDDALGRLLAHAVETGAPHAGLVLDAGGELVGVLLMVFGIVPGRPTRCNLSSWFVDDRFRGYASLLVASATRDKAVTYINISPAPTTRTTIEAQGFRRYVAGLQVAVPLLTRGSEPGMRLVAGEPPADVEADAADRAVMRAHARMGCLTVWCVAGGRAHAFVFQRRRIAGHRITVAYLLYCSAEGDLARFGRALGWFLLRRGLLLAMVDAPAPVAGLVGPYLPGRMPKHAKGPQAPHLGDLAFTEAAVLGEAFWLKRD